MTGTKINPERITSPFQLMAAWFSMLVLLTSIILTAAINITKPEWAAGYLVVFSSVLVVLVLGCVTLMLTVFRPHLQDGKEYSQWLKDKNRYSPGIIIKERAVKNRRNQLQTQKVHGSEKDFLINITDSSGAVRLKNKLSTAGFSAEIYRMSFSGNSHTNKLEDHESIWVGCALPAKEVIESIRIAVSEWPHLKYMHLSNDGGDPPDEVHFQMYFGGSSSTANEYGLLPWSNDELLNLDENMSLEEFHSVIRRKYQ